MTFYQDCIGGELRLTKLGDTPMREQLPPEKYDCVSNPHLKNDDIEISATDQMASPDFGSIVDNTFAVFITGDILGELKPMLDKLIDCNNNHHLQELRKMPFGNYGQFYNKFETQWIFRSTNQTYSFNI